VDEAATISIAGLTRGRALRAGAQGELRWPNGASGLSAATFAVRASDAGLLLELRYTLASRAHALTVELVRGGGPDEWWMLCPSGACGRRVAKLFLPTGRDAFGCQVCHGIQYGWSAGDDL
jgi:hypothetical protein